LKVYALNGIVADYVSKPVDFTMNVTIIGFPPTSS